MPDTNTAAVDALAARMRQAGTDDTAEALIRLALTLAGVLDAPADQERSLASVAKEYRAVLADLAAMKVTAAEEEPDAGLTGTAEVRDAPQSGPAHVGRRGRRGSGDSGATVVALAAPRR